MIYLLYLCLSPAPSIHVPMGFIYHLYNVILSFLGLERNVLIFNSDLFQKWKDWIVNNNIKNIYIYINIMIMEHIDLNLLI